MRAWLARLSRGIGSRLPGGLDGESLCGRAARAYGDDALICRLIDWFLGKGHCAEERRWLGRV